MIAHCERFPVEFSDTYRLRTEYIGVDWTVNSIATDTYRSQIRRSYPAADWISIPLARCPVCKCLTPQVIAIETGMRLCVVCEEVVYPEKHVDGLPRRAFAAARAVKPEDNERETREGSGLAARPPPRSVSLFIFLQEPTNQSVS